MKAKILSICAFVASVLFATSCADLTLTPNQSSGDVEVSFSVGYQSDLGVKTRAISDGNTVNQLTYAVYDAQGVLLNVADPQTGVKTISVGDELDNGVEKEVTLTLTKGQTYKVVFWAQAAECTAYSFNGQNGNISIDLDQVKNNQENADAFYKCVELTVGDQENVPVVMKRPFAQLNVGVTEADWAAAVASGVTIANSQVTINNVANTLNLLTGAVTGDESHTFEVNAIPSAQEELELKDGSTYRYLSTTYFLVNDGSVNGETRATLNSASFVFKSADGKTVNFNSGLNNIPVQRNWRTNLVGQILTGDINFEVSVDKGYVGDIVNPITAADVNAANEAFAGGATSVEIESVTNSDETIILPDTEEGVSITLPTTTSDITVEYTPNGDSPASLNINVPSGDISNITFNIPNTTVYINGEFVDVTALTASNTLIVTSGSEISGTLTVAKGNVEIEKGATVANIVRSNDNPDPITTVTVYDSSNLPQVVDPYIIIVVKQDESDVQTITLKADITLDDILVIDKATILDGNGFTITSNAERAINVNTIEDVVIKNLTIVAKGERGINVIQKPANLLIDDVDVTANNYAVNLASSAKESNVVIKNSTLTGLNVVNVAATYAEISVENSTLKCMDYTDVENYAAVMLNKDAEYTVVTITDTDFEVLGDSWDVYNQTDNGVILVDGVEREKHSAVAYSQWGDYFYAFESLQDAIDSEHTDNYTIILKRSIEVDESIVIPSGKKITLDLSGFTISGEKTCTGSYSMFTNSGDLTITGNGTISFKDLSEGGGQTWGTYNIVNYGTLTVLNGTIEHLGSTTLGDTNYPIQNYQGTVNILGGKINSPNSRSVRDFTAGGTINISGGEFVGQVWMQGLGTGSSTLNISGGNFTPAGVDGSSVFVTNGTNDIIVSITGGTFNTKIGCTDATKEGIAGSITGGTFTEAAKENTKAELLAAGYSFVADGNGMYTVQK